MVEYGDIINLLSHHLGSPPFRGGLQHGRRRRSPKVHFLCNNFCQVVSGIVFI